MNYEKEYKETLEQLYLMQEQITGFQLQEERIDAMFEIRNVIDILLGDKKTGVPINEMFLNTMVTMFCKYGSFYFSELAARREVFIREKELIEAYETILKQKDEIEQLNNTIQFLK